MRYGSAKSDSNGSWPPWLAALLGGFLKGLDRSICPSLLARRCGTIAPCPSEPPSRTSRRPVRGSTAFRLAQAALALVGKVTEVDEADGFLRGSGRYGLQRSDSRSPSRKTERAP